MTALSATADTYRPAVHTLRVNHPTRPQALWLSYLMPNAGRPGELLAVWFDGLSNAVVRVHESIPAGLCLQNTETGEVSLGAAILTEEGLSGTARSAGNRVSWQLVQHPWEDLPLPANPSLPDSVTYTPPHSVFSGTLTVNDDVLIIEDWLGNLSSDQGYTAMDRLAWAQVAGFDNAPMAWFECSTQQLRLGKGWSPWMNIYTLHHDGQVYVVNTLGEGVSAHIPGRSVAWNFDARQVGVRIHGQLQAQTGVFARFGQGPQVERAPHFLTKLANCIVTLSRPGLPSITFSTLHRASFEVHADVGAGGYLLVTRMRGE